MTRRFRRTLTSLSFLTRKAYQKMVTAKPSFFIFAIIAVALSIFLLGGGVYDILEEPLLAITLSGRWIFYYPYSVHEQIPAESLTVMILFAIGFTGFLLTYQSTKYAYKPRQAFMLLLTGALLIMIAYFYIESLVISKLTAVY